MNIRRQFFNRSTAPSGAALLTLPNLGRLSPAKPDTHKRRSSKALELATQASVLDSYKHKDGDPQAYAASATASIRLMAAMFEDQNEAGVTVRDEAYLLSHQDTVRHFEPTPSFLQSLQAQLIALGAEEAEITTQDILVHTSPSQSNLEDHFEQVKAWGLGLFYRNAVQAISSKALGELSTVACSPAYKSNMDPFSSIEADHANRDTLQCATIFASLTENTAAATVFTLWSLVERL
ncbi:hypothetical protein [Granulicella sp. dw_53]|uniref:hypothetical protein n=1 Tax=Granulicella sp. dw_53 TaxID=2719792 RepID=UPI001BD23491|nr:hypothetical protein [Granulicella sp. dw_53]